MIRAGKTKIASFLKIGALFYLLNIFQSISRGASQTVQTNCMFAEEMFDELNCFKIILHIKTSPKDSVKRKKLFILNCSK